MTPEYPSPYHPGGFIPLDFAPRETPASHHMVSFRHDASGARLTVNTLLLGDGTVRTRLDLHLISPRTQRMVAHHPLPSAQARRPIIPFLIPPPGARQQPRTGGGGSSEFHSTALLTTALELEALANHYANQLRGGGWTETASSMSEPLAWQAWQFTGEERKPWSGLFFALHTPERPDDYFLYVRVALNLPSRRR